MKEETQKTREGIFYHKCCIQMAIEEYWELLGKLFADGEITERRFNHLKTFPQRFTDYELKEQGK